MNTAPDGERQAGRITVRVLPVQCFVLLLRGCFGGGETARCDGRFRRSDARREGGIQGNRITREKFRWNRRFKEPTRREKCNGTFFLIDKDKEL